MLPRNTSAAVVGGMVVLGACSAPAATPPRSSQTSRPVVVVDGLESPRTLAGDLESVYWSEGSRCDTRIVRLQRATMSRTVVTEIGALDPDCGLIGGLAVADGNLYALIGSERVYRVAEREGEESRLLIAASPNMLVRAFRVKDGALYYLVNGGAPRESTLHRMNLDTGESRQLARSRPGVSPSLLVDDTHVYWAVGDQSGSAVMRVRVDGDGDAVAVVATAVNAAELAMDEDSLYVVQLRSFLDSMLAPDADYILRIPKNGGPARKNVVGPFLHARVDVSRDHLYWRTRPGRHAVTQTIMRAAKDGGHPEVVASDQANPTDLLIRDDGLLWMNMGNGETANGSLMYLELAR